MVQFDIGSGWSAPRGATHFLARLKRYTWCPILRFRPHDSPAMGVSTSQPLLSSKIKPVVTEERVNQELKRRSPAARIFPNRESCLRLATTLLKE